MCRDDGITLGVGHFLREILRQEKWARAVSLTRGRNPALIFMMEFDLNNHARARRAQRLLKNLFFITIETQRGGRISNTLSGSFGSRTYPRGICQGVCA
jgi:hypothetical protein